MEVCETGMGTARGLKPDAGIAITNCPKEYAGPAYRVEGSRTMRTICEYRVWVVDLEWGERRG